MFKMSSTERTQIPSNHNIPRIVLPTNIPNLQPNKSGSTLNKRIHRQPLVVWILVYDITHKHSPLCIPSLEMSSCKLHDSLGGFTLRWGEEDVLFRDVADGFVVDTK